MMKKLLLLLTCAVFGFNSMHAHDFAYYEQKTRELLPILEIDEAKVLFVATHTEVSIEHRMQKPNAIFLDLEKLNTLTDSMALFECMVSAQLTKLDWSKINDFKPRTSITTAMILPICFGLPCLIGSIIFMNISYPDRPLASCLGLGSLASCAISYLAWRSDHQKDALEKPKKLAQSFIQQELWLRFGTFYQLLNNAQTAHIAIMGMPLTAQCKSNVINGLEGFTAMLGLTIISEWEKLLMRFQHWTELHPQEWERVKKQLEAEKQAFDAFHGNEKTVQ